MTRPDRFFLSQQLRHQRPEFVRAVALSAGFRQDTLGGTRASEIWTKPDGNGGYWIVRIDAMGHGTGKVVMPKSHSPGEKLKPNYFFSERPHYHKNWVSSKILLDKYVTSYVKEAWIYDDNGNALCTAGDLNAMHPDQKAKLQHILR